MRITASEIGLPFTSTTVPLMLKVSVVFAGVENLA
jgi:hypothetical protein